VAADNACNRANEKWSKNRATRKNQRKRSQRALLILCDWNGWRLSHKDVQCCLDTKKADPPPTKDRRPRSGMARANGCWLQCLDRSHNVIIKTHSCGASCYEWFGQIDAIPKGQSQTKLISLFREAFQSWGNGNLTVIVGKLAFVKLMVNERENLAKPHGVRVGCGLPDVVNLPAFVMPGRIRQKQYAGHPVFFGRDVEQIPVWLTPDCVELGLNENSRPLPDRPSDYLLASVLCNVLWEYIKTRTLGGSRQWIQRDINRLWLGDDAPTKSNNIGTDKLWWSHGVALTPNEKAELPPTRDVNRDSGTASANGG